MDAENSNRKGNAKMAFPIDLNETPVSSPREAFDDTVLGTASVSICTVCRKGIPVGRVPATEEQRREFKCFRCLLKNEGPSSSGRGGGGVDLGRFDINASPPLEAEEGDDFVAAAGSVGRDGDGGARFKFYFFFYPFFFSFVYLKLILLLLLQCLICMYLSASCLSPFIIELVILSFRECLFCFFFLAQMN